MTRYEIAEPARPRWLSVLLFVWPWALGLVLLLSAVGWGLWQSTSSDGRAAAGALAIWLGENAVLVVFLMLRYSLWRDPEGSWPRVRPTMVKQWRLSAVVINLAPGLWIGLGARHPVATAVATRLATYLFGRLHSLRLPRAEWEPIMSKAYFKKFCFELAVLCSGAIIGSVLRSWRG